MQSVERALAILRQFRADRPEMEVPDISAGVRLPTSTVYRLLGTMRAAGFVEAGTRGGTFRLGPVAAGIGYVASLGIRADDLVHAALACLSETTRESCGLCVPVGEHAVLVDLVASAHPVRPHYPVGAHFVLEDNAACSALLAWLPEPALDARLGFLRHGRRSARTRLLDELEGVRARGYARRDDEAEGVVTLAAPARDFSGSVVAAVVVFVPSQRVGGDAEERIVPLLLATATAVSARFGHLPSVDAVR